MFNCNVMWLNIADGCSRKKNQPSESREKRLTSLSWNVSPLSTKKVKVYKIIWGIKVKLIIF